jgi:hypothetical protein
MCLESLFAPQILTDKERSNYLNSKLEKTMNKFKKEGLSGNKYKNKVYWAKIEIEEGMKSGNVNKYIKPNDSHKLTFRNHIISHNLLSLFKMNENAHYHLPVKIRTHNNFTNYICKQNLFSLIFPNFKKFDKGGRNTCIFTSNNIGWISKDYKGYFRYYSKCEKTGITFGFSIFDLIEIVYDECNLGSTTSYQKARRLVATILHIQYNELEFVMQEEDKYDSNIKVLLDQKLLKEMYPNLFILIKNHLCVLTELHIFAKNHIMKKQYAIKKNSVFFVATRTIENILIQQNIKKDHSTISSAINIFATLELLQKVPSKTIKNNQYLYNVALKMRKDKKYKLINCMSIPMYNEKVLKKAEKMAIQLRKNNITNVKRLSKVKLIKIFGEKKANEVIEEISLYKIDANELYELAKLKSPEYPF